MSRLLHVDGIVLSTLDLGERDRIVRLLSPDLGRVSCVARGARGSTRRFVGALDLGNRIHGLLRQGRGDLPSLDEASASSSRLGLRRDLLRMALCAYACELCGLLAREAQPEPRFFGLLETFLTLIDSVEGPPGLPLRLGFEAKALSYAGWTPVLLACARCGEALPELCLFSSEAGGALHAGCAGGLALSGVSRAFLASIEELRRTRLIEVLDRPLPPGPPELLRRFAEHHLGRGLRSGDWLATLDLR